MAEVGLLPFARVALEVATTVLPPYRSRFSKHQFTIEEEQCFKYTGPPPYYRPCQRQDLGHVGYGANRANGVLCTVLTKQ